LRNGPFVQVLAPLKLWQVLFKIRAYRIDSANFLGGLVPVNKKFLEGVTRINVVGVSGSGKSTLAKQIAQRLRLAYFEMDEMFWLPNWQEPDDEDFFERIDQVTQEEAWVLDGNYRRLQQIKWQRVQVVVWIDLPYAQVIWQLVKRTYRRVSGNEVLWAGNVETLKRAFSSSSVIWWSLKNLRARRREYTAAANSAGLAHIQFIRLRSRRQIDAFLAGLTDG